MSQNSPDPTLPLYICPASRIIRLSTAATPGLHFLLFEQALQFESLVVLQLLRLGQVSLLNVYI